MNTIPSSIYPLRKENKNKIKRKKKGKRKSQIETDDKEIRPLDQEPTITLQCSGYVPA